MDHSEALSALDAKRAAEAQMARAANCPPWRHAVFGLMMGGLIASFAFEFAIRTAILVLVLACIPLIIRSDRKRMGMFINGYRRGKTRVVTFGLLALWVPLYALSVHYSLSRNDHQMPLLLGLIGFAIGTAGSVLWQRVFVREMGA
ncbi:putative membrane protein [Sphingomonas sp. F9_3S_D5_B_2]